MWNPLEMTVVGNFVPTTSVGSYIYCTPVISAIEQGKLDKVHSIHHLSRQIHYPESSQFPITKLKSNKELDGSGVINLPTSFGLTKTDLKYLLACERQS